MLYRKQSGVMREVATVHKNFSGELNPASDIYKVQNGVLTPVYHNVVTITLADDQENFWLNAWLVNQGIKDNSNVVVNIPDGVTIGGTVSGAYAFQLGNINRLKSLTINLSGRIEGKGGVNSSKGGSHALRSVHPFTLNVLPTGFIAGGGGAGGTGGAGAWGDWINWVSRLYGAGSDTCYAGSMDFWRYHGYVRICNGPSGDPGGYPYLRSQDPKEGWQWLRDSGVAGGDPADDTGEKTNKIQYAGPERYYKEAGGAGGAGADGQGYNQPLGDRNQGGYARWPAGEGADGGGGGEWGQDGGASSNGNHGNRFYRIGYSGRDQYDRWSRRNYVGGGGQNGGQGGRALTVPNNTIVTNKGEIVQ